MKQAKRHSHRQEDYVQDLVKGGILLFAIGAWLALAGSDCFFFPAPKFVVGLLIRFVDLAMVIEEFCS